MVEAEVDGVEGENERPAVLVALLPGRVGVLADQRGGVRLYKLLDLRHRGVVLQQHNVKLESLKVAEERFSRRKECRGPRCAARAQTTVAEWSSYAASMHSTRLKMSVVPGRNLGF